MINETFAVFADIMKKHFLEHYAHNLKRLQALAEQYPKKEQFQTRVYNMMVVVNYKKLLTTFNNLLEKGWAKTTFLEKVGPKHNLLEKGWTKNQPWRNVNL